MSSRLSIFGGNCNNGLRVGRYWNLNNSSGNSNWNIGGSPVTVWYVLAEPETAIVNEPLAKIGDYADELSSKDSGVSIPTARGQNTLTVDTELQPSEMTITGYIKQE